MLERPGSGSTLKDLNGVPAWHYISQFKDPQLGVGLHDVYFIFSGAKLEKLLFQAFPIPTTTRGSKAVFDAVVDSYRTGSAKTETGTP